MSVTTALLLMIIVAMVSATIARYQMVNARRLLEKQNDELLRSQKLLDSDLERVRRAEEQARQQLVEVERARDQAAEKATATIQEQVREQVEVEARRRAENIAKDARDRAILMNHETHRTLKDAALREERALRRESLVARKEEILAQRELEISERERALIDRESRVREREESVADRAKKDELQREEITKKEKDILERAAGLTKEQAYNKLVSDLLDQAQAQATREIRIIEERHKEEAEKQAKRVIGIALQRYSGEHTQERAVTTVHIPNNDIKGKLIGREGRNIRSFQDATGCDLLIDDTPETIVVSAFDPVKREVARVALERLIQDGRIHPTRIEEIVAQAKSTIDRSIIDAAEQAAMELGVGTLHPQMAQLLGQLRYRYSYAQNVLRHCVEVGYLAGLIAGELGVSVRLARRAGLLHDIGKSVSHQVEGGHAVVGAQQARKFGEDDLVVRAIASHHEDEEIPGLLGHIVMAADAISSARPGARRENLEDYVRRLEDLEKISKSFKGVERVYALQAGREVRVFVEPGQIDDLGATTLTRDIAKRIEAELAYPGQIRVVVIRETRAVDYAR